MLLKNMLWLSALRKEHVNDLVVLVNFFVHFLCLCDICMISEYTDAISKK